MFLNKIKEGVRRLSTVNIHQDDDSDHSEEISTEESSEEEQKEIKQKISPKTLQRKAKGEQILTEYLVAHRNHEPTDKAWEQVHMKGLGKKRFQRLAFCHLYLIFWG